MRRFGILCAVVCTLAWGWAQPAGAQTASPPPPASMAAIGDSITRATDACCWYGDHPANSWSTGAAGWDGVTSHYERLRALNPTLTAYNDSAAGSKVAAGPGQARVAVSQQAHYVTVLLGANDLCTSTPQDMTPVDDFRAHAKQTLDTLAAAPTTAQIFVSSIPNVYWLWQIEHTNPVAQLVWRAGSICQSLLAVGRTDAERQLVRQRNSEFNAILGEECATIMKCRFDGNAVFNYQFAPAQVSHLDYFHPSLRGQAALADVTWATGWWR